MSRMSAYLTMAALPILFAGCGSTVAPTSDAVPSTVTEVAGWYSQQAGSASLQPCGEDRPLSVADGEQLRQRAQEFELQDGDPVYVRVRGARSDSSIRIEAVDQFGSPAPVRDCPLTGTRIQG